MRSLGLLPCLIPQVFCHSEVPVFLTVAALRINWAGVICDRVIWSRFLEAVSTRADRNFLNSRTPISARFGQGVCGPAGKPLYIKHSMECLHAMTMVEGQVCTSRLRIHLESVHPFMTFGDDF